MISEIFRGSGPLRSGHVTKLGSTDVENSTVIVKQTSIPLTPSITVIPDIVKIFASPR